MNNLKLIHSIYYYVIVFFAVAAIAVSSVALTRRVLIDSFFPDIANNSSYYYSEMDCEGMYQEENYTREGSSKLQARRMIEEDRKKCEESREREEENAKKRVNIDRQETYLSSFLTIFVAGIVLFIHYRYVNPNRTKTELKKESEVIEKDKPEIDSQPEDKNNNKES